MHALKAPNRDEPTPDPAQSPTLGRRFVDLLLADTARIHSVMTGGDPVPDLDDLPEFGTMVDASDAPVTEEIGLSVDVATTAVLLAAAFEAEPGVLRALRTAAPVVVVRLPDEDLLASVKSVLSVCVFGRTTPLVEDGSTMYKLAGLRADRRAAVVMPCDAVRKRDELDDWAVRAMSLGVPICAVSTDPQQGVPKRIRTTADHVLEFGRWTGQAVSLVIEAVTGSVIEVPNGPWIGSIALDDLRSSVSRRRGGAGSLERLRWIVEKRLATSAGLPRLEDLSGYGEAKGIGLDLIADLQAYRDGRLGWRDIDRGMLLAGPPGVGKSFFARVFAHSAGLPLVSASLAQWQAAGHLGDLLKSMRRSFSDARAAAPCVLFIDELDSLGDRSTFEHRHRDYSIQVVNGLLEQLDGVGDREGVVVLGATNHVRMIDPAIVRPGRIDRVVWIDLPDPVEMVGILRTCLGSDLNGADLMPVARAGTGGSGADAASWCRRARGTARRAGRKLLVEDLLEAVRSSRSDLSEEDLHRCAIHEAAHACAAAALGVGTIGSLTLSDAGGSIQLTPRTQIVTADRAIRDIVSVLAGRAGEMVFLGSPSAGAGGTKASDLAKATGIAMAYELSWGLGHVGPLWHGDPTDGLSALGSPPGSMIAVHRVLRHAEAEAERLVRRERFAIERLATRLLDAGHLVEAEIAPLLAEIPPFEIRPCTSPLPPQSCSSD
ncbi:AAA family ATPase [uncultured Aureimonas sp.]|uniref:AAA family ATPase n=1 Tax=uncultured Aureimonas sp. TaxID=1604662 RepID=UPI0025E587C7|nr:AAA family ATPase [uncultured Aureimonas sp.]